MKRWFGNLRLAHKLGIGFGATIALMLLIIAVALNGAGGLQDQLSSLSTKTLAAEVDMAHFSYSAGRVRILQYRVAGNTGEAAKKLAQETLSAEAKADEDLKSYESLVVDPEDRKNTDELNRQWEHYKQIWSQNEPKIEAADTAVGFKLLEDSTVEPYAKGLVPAVDKVVEWRETAGRKSGQDGVALATTVSRVIVWVGFLAVFVAALFGWIITKSIVMPLNLVATKLKSVTDVCISNLSAGLQAFAKGDLRLKVAAETTPIADPTRDEVGQMATSFNVALEKMHISIECYNDARESLSSIVRQLSENSRSVAETSQGLAASSEQSGAASSEIASGSEKLAREATSVAAVMEELSALIESSRDGISQQSRGVSDAAKDMAAAAQEGNKAVKQTVSAMELVQQQVRSSAAKVQELDEKGKQIGQIVQSIEDIAGQTNLLALNAAIEAARAGEHGRGFAVVADEVRKLAEKASAATQSIGHLVQGITLTVSDTVAAIESTRTQVEDGAQASASAGEALEKILEASAGVADQCSRMAKDSDRLCGEMAQGANEVAASISGVAAVSQQSSAGCEELSAGIEEVGAAAGELGAMSAELNNVVAKFQVEETGSNRLRVAA